jgi:uncharacterized protein YdeI (YjbR/CyaY-like superfamily)
VCATRGPEKPPLTRAVDTAPTVEVRSRPDLRGWLAANRSNSPSVWLVSWKKHTPHYLPCGEVVEELLCWGWINSVPRAVEDDRTSILIAPRSPESTWLEVNKDKVAAARASGAMTGAGEQLIRIAEVVAALYTGRRPAPFRRSNAEGPLVFAT